MTKSGSGRTQRVGHKDVHNKGGGAQILISTPVRPCAASHGHVMELTEPCVSTRQYPWSRDGFVSTSQYPWSCCGCVYIINPLTSVTYARPESLNVYFNFFFVKPRNPDLVWFKGATSSSLCMCGCGPTCLGTPPWRGVMIRVNVMISDNVSLFGVSRCTYEKILCSIIPKQTYLMTINYCHSVNFLNLIVREKNEAI